ncbi:uncharacterized protein LOC128253870 isoform X1 [Drosophila gunungcola]|uniref:uncharacterized protein LOC128253870 isoform X1 n=1 Tax=Drosophila gunungcola TaxID=103775 RepID=UPI0022E0EBFB|nr:uncharacterized protein LOC128253870 isoform X1 [Drosophila gunungcola]
MPASSGLYRIKHGRVLDRLQKPSAFIFIIAYIAACGICDHTASADEASSTAATMSSSVRHINQNLIMSQAKAGGEPVPVPLPFAQSQQSAASGGGSSISGFDSTNNVIDGQPTPTHLQEEPPLQTHSHSRIQAKDTAGPYPIPAHRPEPVENHLEATNGIEGGGMESLFGTPMYFGTENSTVVTTQIGATAHVPCTVHHIGEGVVSWIRKKDYHLLTVGLTTYSSDERFSATHLKHSEDWTLQIKFVQLRDAGVYECQVSTHPPTSIFLHLSVVEARAEITGPPIRYLTPGSTLRLQCRVVQNTEASEYIFWYHDNRMINYDIDRGINVSTEPDFQSSELTIQRTRREHSGNFTCVASNTQPASVLVHIFKGDNPAAMYHGHVGGSTKTMQSQLHMIMIIIASGYRIFHTSVYMKIV